jgi:hypothetical protein
MDRDLPFGRPPVLPGSVLDLVIDGPDDSRFTNCIRISDIVWRYGFQSCRTQSERDAWMKRYVDHLMSQIEV